jgi:hypothetical protein
MLVDMEAAYITASVFREAQAAAVAAQLERGALESGPPAEEVAAKAAARKSPPPPPPLLPPGSAEGFSPEMEAHLRRISNTVCEYISQVSAGLLRSIPKAVVFVFVSPARGALLQPLIQSLSSLG